MEEDVAVLKVSEEVVEAAPRANEFVSEERATTNHGSSIL
jgi:hypothetical protein